MKAIGYIRLSREFMNWRWYTNPNTMRVYLHLLMMANFCEAEFETHIVKRGQLVTNIKSLCEQLGMTTQSVRTALRHLKLTNDITISTTAKYSIITILNYEQYASATNTVTNEQPAVNNQITTNQQQYNNKKKYNKSINNDVTDKSCIVEALEKKSLFKD